MLRGDGGFVRIVHGSIVPGRGGRWQGWYGRSEGRMGMTLSMESCVDLTR
jgi:hypothetical protein